MSKSDFGLIGLAVMGQNLVLNVESRGFQVSVFNRTTTTTDEFIAKHPGKRLVGAKTLEEFVQSLATPRKIQIMVKSTATQPDERDAVDAVIEQLIPLLEKDDIIIDGGNSFYKATERRDAYLAGKGLRFIGAGVSGGEEGARKGPAIMPGGPPSTWEVMKPIFESISAKVDGEPCVIHIGPGGAGHYVKMIHNGIEYGMMAAMAEGLNILKHANVGMRDHAVDAETTPLSDPRLYQYEFDLAAITEVWRRGSVIASWLLDLTAAALARDPELEQFEGRVSDSGEGRWSLQAAIDESVPANVLAAALFSRFSSRGQADFQDRALSAMRYGFGGHLEKPQ